MMGEEGTGARALDIGLQRRRICPGRPASNAAIATSCYASGSGVYACYCGAEEENLFGTAPATLQ
jgi:hypothetical protein